MSLFGLIGTVISGVGSFISSVGQAAGNEALANLGSSIGSFGATVSSWGQSSTEASPAPSGSAPAQPAAAPPAPANNPAPPTPAPDISQEYGYSGAEATRLFYEDYDRFLQYAHDWFASQTGIMTYADLCRYADYNPVGQEVALVIATQGIPENMDAETYLKRFAYADPDWNREDYEVALAVVKAATANRKTVRFGDVDKSLDEEFGRFYGRHQFGDVQAAQHQQAQNLRGTPVYDKRFGDTQSGGRFVGQAGENTPTPDTGILPTEGPSPALTPEPSPTVDPLQEPIIIILGGSCGGTNRGCEGLTQPYQLTEWISALTTEGQTVIIQDYPGKSESGYVVRAGDTLTNIAQRYQIYGVTVEAIQQANNISNPNQISIGQSLNIPGVTSSEPVGKQLQAQLAYDQLVQEERYGERPIIIIGWSAGGDSALYFADAYGGQDGVTIRNIVMLGPTLTGEYINTETGERHDNSWLSDNYQRIMEEAVGQRTNISVVEDSSSHQLAGGMPIEIHQELVGFDNNPASLFADGNQPENAGGFDYVMPRELGVPNDELVYQDDFAGGPRYTYGHYHERFPNARNLNNDPDLIIYVSNKLGLQVNPEWLESQ